MRVSDAMNRILAALCIVSWATVAAAQTPQDAAQPPQQSSVSADQQQPAVSADQQPTVAAGQQDQHPPPPNTAAAGEEGHKKDQNFFKALGHNLGDDVKHIPRRNSAYWLAGGIGLAFAVHPIDHTFNQHLTAHTNYFVAGQYMGELYTILGAGVAAYTFGRAADYPRTEHLGMDEIEGVILSEGIVEGAKYVIRRPRPSNPGGILKSDYSMPSGHATMTFAAATILQQHLGYKAGIPTYLIATYVAMSRLHDNVHYASDVVMGAATGIIIGRSVTWHGRNFFGELQPVPGGIGVSFATK
jgi:membrane-associated phospholipid phosphatase